MDYFKPSTAIEQVREVILKYKYQCLQPHQLPYAIKRCRREAIAVIKKIEDKFGFTRGDLYWIVFAAMNIDSPKEKVVIDRPYNADGDE